MHFHVTLIVNKKHIKGVNTKIPQAKALITSTCGTSYLFVVVTGLEPVLKEPKSFVLPLHHTTEKVELS